MIFFLLQKAFIFILSSQSIEINKYLLPSGYESKRLFKEFGSLIIMGFHSRVL